MYAFRQLSVFVNKKCPLFDVQEILEAVFLFYFFCQVALVETTAHVNATADSFAGEVVLIIAADPVDTVLLKE